MRHPNITSTLAGLIVVTSVCYSAGLAERGFKDLLASIQARLGVAGSKDWLVVACRGCDVRLLWLYVREVLPEERRVHLSLLGQVRAGRYQD